MRALPVGGATAFLDARSGKAAAPSRPRASSTPRSRIRSLLLSGHAASSASSPPGSAYFIVSRAHLLRRSPPRAKPSKALVPSWGAFSGGLEGGVEHRTECSLLEFVIGLCRCRPAHSTSPTLVSHPCSRTAARVVPTSSQLRSNSPEFGRIRAGRVCLYWVDAGRIQANVDQL